MGTGKYLISASQLGCRVLVGLFVLWLMGCAEPALDVSNQGGGKIESASWDAQTRTLLVNGSATDNGGRVAISDGDNGNLLAEAKVSRGQWRADIKTAVCAVTVDFGANTQTLPVTQAPAACATLTNFQRAVRANALSDDVLLSHWPNGAVMSPAEAAVTIDVGGSVNFSATGTDPNNKTPLSFFWDFAGGAINSRIQNPGDIAFTKAGIYPVKLTVTNGDGASDPTSALRIVTVQIPTAGLEAPIEGEPNAQIVLPAGDTSIMVGETLEFLGSGIGQGILSSNTLDYRWNFGTAVVSPVPDTNSRSPGRLTFNAPGTYLIELRVQAPSGLVSLTPAQVSVIVIDNVNNSPPVGFINSPTTDVAIDAGGAVMFTAIGSDPEGHLPLTFRWNFASVAGPIVTQNPGSIVFPNPGVFPVTLWIDDNLGARTPTPAVRIITVRDARLTNDPTPTHNSILTPPMDITVDPGVSVNFTGQAAVDATAVEPLSYLWRFDGAAPDVMALSPGEITFMQMGDYEVSFTVADATGRQIATPVVRRIIVQDSGTFTAVITSPLGDTMIDVGGSVNFAGDIVNPLPLPNITYMYHWQFSKGVADDLIEQNPGLIPFNQSGKLKVKLTVMAMDTTTDVMVGRNQVEVAVTVRDPNALSGGIIQPATDLMINVGESIWFEGQAPAGVVDDVIYRWEFEVETPMGEVSLPEKTEQIPGELVFDHAGLVEVEYETIGLDAQGQRVKVVGERSIIVNNLANIPTPTPEVTPMPATPTPMPTTPTPMPATPAPDPVTPTPMPATPTPMPATPTPMPATPAPDPVTPTPMPATPVPDPATPTPMPATPVPDPATPTPMPATPVPDPAEPSPTVVPPASVITGTILSPMTDVTIRVGETLNFSATAFDPVGEAMSFIWNFDGGVSNSNAQSPGGVTFSQVGVFVVTLIVHNALGAVDSNPPRVTITVIP